MQMYLGIARQGVYTEPAGSKVLTARPSLFRGSRTELIVTARQSFFALDIDSLDTRADYHGEAKGEQDKEDCTESSDRSFTVRERRSEM